MRMLTGVGGVALIVSLFLPWADGRSGWELATPIDVLLVLAGATALAAALTGGRLGVFRPDVTLIGAADLLGVVSTVVVAWLLLFDFPDGATREAGAYLALLAAATVAGGAGDYETARSGRWFPQVDEAGRPGR